MWSAEEPVRHTHNDTDSWTVITGIRLIEGLRFSLRLVGRKISGH